MSKRRNGLTALTGFLLATFITVGVVQAQVQRQRPPIPLTPAQKQQYDALLPELRCLVCQDESLAASQAALAADLRYEIRGMVAKGENDRQIKHYLVQRYGAYVLFKPPFEPTTWLLWIGPFLFVLLAAIVVWSYLRRRTKAPTQSSIDADALQKLLDQDR